MLTGLFHCLLISASIMGPRLWFRGEIWKPSAKHLSAKPPDDPVAGFGQTHGALYRAILGVRQRFD